MHFARVLPWCLLAAVAVPTAASAAPIELTPAGDEVCCQPSEYSIRGYRFTVSEAFTAYGIEWWVQVPVGATMAARIRDLEGTLLLEGEATPGNGVDDWLRAPFEFAFEAGQTYEVLVYTDAPDDVLFRHSSGGCCDYPVPPLLTAVTSVSNQGEDDTPSTTYNVWPAYMRLITDAPDGDGDGVADGADACPDTAPNEPVGADGCPMAADTGSAGTGEGGTTQDGGTASTAGSGGSEAGASTNAGADDEGSSGAVPSAGGADSTGCGCRNAGTIPAPWLAIAIVALTRGRRRARVRTGPADHRARPACTRGRAPLRSRGDA